MKKLICAVTVLAVSTAQADTIYVDDDAAPGGDGLSWNTAYQFLQDALATAVAGTEIRVAEGVYLPDQDEAGDVTVGDRFATFQLVNGVSMMGGFAGLGAPDPDKRSIDGFETVLSGDLVGDDGPDFLNNQENSYHVVTISAVDGTTVLDGLTVRAGNADGMEFPEDRGAGIYNDQGNPVLTMCTIAGNWANRGAGMYNVGASPTLMDCCFCGNTANLWGGGIYNENDSSPTLTGCSFENNRGNFQSGGGIMNFDTSSPSLVDCTFIGNFAGAGGGMASSFASTATVQGCVFVANTAGGSYGTGSAINGGNPTVTGCTFLANGNTAVSGAPLITDCTFIDNQNGVWNPGVIADCVFSGTPSVAIDHRSGKALVTNCTFTGTGVALFCLNSAETVMVACTIDGMSTGAYISEGSLSLVNCTIRDVDNAITIYDGDGPTLSMTDCTVVGAGRVINAVNGDAVSTLTNCTLAGIDIVLHFSSLSSQTFAFNNCTLVGNGTAATFGYLADPHISMNNCILWDSPLSIDAGTIDVTYSDVQGGLPGIGNIDANPLFVDPDNSDYRLSPGSPCIDAGDNTAVPEDITTDLDGNPRFLEIPETPDTGNGTLPIVDMGAYESLGGGCLAVTSQEVVCHADGTTFTVNIEGLNACTGGTTQVSFTASGGAVGEELCFTALVNDGGFCCTTEICVTIPDCTPNCDLNGDGIVGIVDYLSLFSAWGSCSDCGTCAADFDGDCSVGILDMLILLGNWFVL